MLPKRVRFQELRSWVGSHRVLVISALNASLFLFLTCFLALMIEVSAKKEAHAQVGAAAARSREVEASSVPASHATSADKPVPAKKYVARRTRPSPTVETPVRLGHREYPVEVRERSTSRRAPEPAVAEPEEGVPAEGTPPEGMPAEGIPDEGETTPRAQETTR